MSPRASIAGLFLFATFTALIVVSSLFDGMNIVLFKGAPLVLEGQYPLYLGQLSFSIVCLSLALIVLDVLNDFFGTSVAFVACIAACIGLLVIICMLRLLPWIPAIEAKNDWLNTYRLIFNLSLLHHAGLMATIVIGFGSTSVFFSLFRRITSARFDYFRLFISTLLGCVMISSVETFVIMYPSTDKGLILATLITRYLQWLTCILFCIPFYYFLKVIFFIFAEKNTAANQSAKSGIFKHPPVIADSKDALKNVVANVTAKANDTPSVSNEGNS